MVTPKKKLMIEALKRQLGIVSLACKEVKIARKTHYQWLKTDENYKQAVNEIDDYAIDFVENALFKQISEGNTAAIIFYMKCRAKNRGYIERPDTQVNIQNNEAKYVLKIIKPDDNPYGMETQPEAV
jgi:hypothetical protein